MYQTKLTRSAEQDLDKIAEHIAKDSIDRAIKYTEKIIDSFSKQI